ncbi:hypothetical protein ACPB8Q_00140 [Methanocaldococcus indicus]|uniref:hypothetical protein n=1 Tax=Methanocaldococcus indicus TaxID=213231 RepID=UPI003C6D9C82
MKKTFFIFFVISIFICCIYGEGIGITGNILSSSFEIPAGGDVSGGYIRFYNPSDSPINIHMEYYIKPETNKIHVLFSENNFTLKPKEGKSVYITIKVDNDCVPGKYIVQIVGEAYKTTENRKGTIILPAAGTNIKVNVLGEYSYVSIYTKDKNGNNVACKILLYNKDNQLIATNDTGILKKKVVPGEYLTKAILLGNILNETKFTVKPYENKTVILIVNTVSIPIFKVVPINSSRSIKYFYIYSLIDNMYKPLDNVKLVLNVYKNKKLIDKIDIANIYQLPIGKYEYKYNYIPNNFSNGIYSFQLELYSKDRLYTSTPKIDVNYGTINENSNKNETSFNVFSNITKIIESVFKGILEIIKELFNLR